MAGQTPHNKRQQRPPASPTPLEINASELSLFWAAAIILQYLSQLDWVSRLSNEPLSPSSIAQTTAVLLAAIAILRPSNVRLFLCMATAQICAGWINLPEIPNHRLFTTLFNLTLLLSATSLRLSSNAISISALWDVARPFTRRLLCTLYLFAAFAKLNSTYLLSNESCGVQLYHEISSYIPLPQHSLAAHLSAWLGMIVEFLLPLALLFSTHRHKAILVGLLFHYVIAIDSARHFSDFSAVSFAALLTFAARPILSPMMWKLLRRVLLFGAIACVYSGTLAVRAVADIQFFLIARDLMWLAYSTSVVSSFVLARLASSEPLSIPPRSTAFRLSRHILSIPLALAIINGLSPYLGFKTRSGWDMYSNLQLVGQQSNHAIIPRSLDLLGQLHAPITILESSNTLLHERYKKGNYDITAFELRKIFADDPSGTTTFRWEGRIYENFQHRSGAPPLSTPPHWLSRKLLWFRQIDQSSEPRCQW